MAQDEISSYLSRVVVAARELEEKVSEGQLEKAEGAFLLRVKGIRTSYLISKQGLQEVSDGQELSVTPDVTLTYSTPAVFWKVVRGELSGQAAVFSGKVGFKGNIGKAKLLEKWFKAVKAESSLLVKHDALRDPVPLSQWEDDEVAEDCRVCKKDFNVYRRRHHCRMCGLVVCASCSREKLLGSRACDVCYRVNTNKGASNNKALSGQTESPVLTEDSEIVEALKLRITGLEKELLGQDRRYFYSRADLLRLAVNSVHKLLILLALATYLGFAHIVALAVVTRYPASISVPSLSFLVDAFSGSMGKVDLTLVGGGVHLASESAKNSICSDDSSSQLSGSDNSSMLGGDPLIGCGEPVTDISVALPHMAISTYWAVMCIALLLVWIHHKITKGNVQRRLKTFMLAAVVIFGLKYTRRIARRLPEAESDALWSYVYRLLAPFAHRSILELKGLWVKFGQFSSSRADVMPQPFIDEFSKLQDAVPPSEWSSVRDIIERELGKKVNDAFGSVEETALASASIAQVHVGKLKDGTKIVVKVQHPDVDRLMLGDLQDINTIVSLVAWFDGEFNFRPIFKEWTNEVKKELDFCNEAENLRRIHSAMAKSGLDVVIPELVEGFTTRCVLVMKFCEGFKVTDVDALERASMDREEVMRVLCESFAHQVHIEGLFNADPHPGNLLIQVKPGVNGGPSTATPVILDWGLAKLLPHRLRIAFSQFVYAASEMDYVMMLKSFDSMGIKLNRADPMEDMTNIRFLMRDTAPPDEARAETKRFARVMVKRRAAGKRNPVDAYPGDVIFFMRLIQLLHGLGSRLHCKSPYMAIMAPYAQRALIEEVPAHLHSTSVIYPTPVLSPLDEKVRSLLKQLVADGEVRGCQVCVMQRDKVLVNCCVGTQGPVDPRPVTPSTVFCVFSVTKLAAGVALLKCVDQGLAAGGLDTLVTSFWPAFGQNGKETTTLRHILTHSTGLQHAMPSSPNPERLCDWKLIQQCLEEAVPVWTPGEKSTYHYFTFGWLVAACVERLAKMPFAEYLRKEVWIPLEVSDEAFVGDVSTAGGAGAAPERVATIENSMFKDSFGKSIEEEQVEVETGMEKTFLHMIADAIRDEDPAEGAALQELGGKLRHKEYLLDPRIFNSRQIQESCIPAANGLFTARALAALSSNLMGSLEGNVGGILRKDTVDVMRRLSSRDVSALHRLFGLPDRSRFGLGCQLFGFKESQESADADALALRNASDGTGALPNGINGVGKAKRRTRFSGFGHTGVGGSACIVDAVTGTSFAMVTNRIKVGRKATSAVYNLVCQELGMGEPSQLFG